MWSHAVLDVEDPRVLDLVGSVMAACQALCDMFGSQVELSVMSAFGVMVRGMYRKLAFVVCLVSLGGCTGQYYRIPSPQFDSAKYEVLGKGTGTGTGIMLFNFIPINQNNKIERATEELIKSKGGDAITDVTVRERWFWAYVLNGYKFDVEGTVLKRKPEAEGMAVTGK